MVPYIHQGRHDRRLDGWHHGRYDDYPAVNGLCCSGRSTTSSMFELDCPLMCKSSNWFMVFKDSINEKKNTNVLEKYIWKNLINNLTNCKISIIKLYFKHNAQTLSFTWIFLIIIWFTYYQLLNFIRKYFYK